MSERYIVNRYHATRVFFRLKTYKNIAYLLASFPLGLAYFLFLIIGLALGGGLSVILIGIPILILVFAIALILARFERWLANILLDADVVAVERELPPDASVWNRIKAIIANPFTYKGILFLFLKLPLGLASLVMTALFVGITFGLLLMPLHYQRGDVKNLGFWQIDSLPEALLCCLLGLVIGGYALPVLDRIAEGWRGLAASLLGDGRQGEKRHLVIIRQYYDDAYPDYFLGEDMEEKAKREFVAEELFGGVHLAKPKRGQVSVFDGNHGTGPAYDE